MNVALPFKVREDGTLGMELPNGHIATAEEGAHFLLGRVILPSHHANPGFCDCDKGRDCAKRCRCGGCEALFAMFDSGGELLV